MGHATSRVSTLVSAVQAEVQAEIVLGVVAGAAHHFVDLAAVAAAMVMRAPIAERLSACR